ncbi:MAG: transglutaminase family protein [Deltaproteobacteria bacterium]|nr:transglutaminase family protein [Myxococcales bacterium]MDP3212569.1 transglutaminase family protein [Deltaproteobacteria bacterium]
MRVRIRHETRYRYPRPTALGPQVVRLRPAGHARAAVLAYNLAIEPEAEVRWQHDPWGNRVARLTFPAEALTRDFALRVECAVDIRPVNPFDFFVDDRCQRVPFVYPDGLTEELAPFLSRAVPSARLAAWLEGSPAGGYVTDHLVALNARVAREVRYILRAEPGIQGSDETLAKGSGSCRDSALLLVDALRAQGFAARFVSGYLVQLADEGELPDQAKGVERDVVDLHAWAEVFVPGAGWIGLDGTSGLLCGEGHLPLACTVNPELAAPIDGTSSEPAEAFEVTMEVTRLGHEASPRRPYTDAQWAALRAAGDHVDRRLTDDGLALTMGGEPTWTSREHPHDPEWNLEALGPSKWSQALRLTRELAPRIARGGVVMHRMGKQYPGESLPRWVMQLSWRDDGVPLWRDPRWLDLDDDAARKPLADDEARRFAAALSTALGVPDAWMPAYEDPWHFVAREQDLPPDIDPLAADLRDPEARRTLARALGRGLGSPVGFVLPLTREGDTWATAPWCFRRGALHLIPGDSPVGLRLPLDRIDGTPRATHLADVTLGAPALAADPWRPLPTSATAVATAAAPPPPVDPLPTGSVRTALCVEARDGALCVFLPPVERAEDFVTLLAAVEAAAVERQRPVRLEGYGPKGDPRVQSCLVTPDPGVIEVNLPVTRDFRSYVDTLESIGRAALHAGLTSERFQLDGRAAGTGGGHHLTLGGPTTVESPFLRRPDLLASTLRFLQHHPSLSYLFTGLFVGPTSQAPRVDEARHESLSELEIALDLADRAEAPPPWLTDRLFRNLLVDVTGSTHRTELSIDKLYDPATLHGRQGIVEFRAFEMPPNERMAAAQMLLVRAMVAVFSRERYVAPLVRWGSQLHDRFMLPHHLWSDLQCVLEHFAARGVALDPAWYEPFVELRFPVSGRVTLDDVTLELRPALEPWPVLGEEPTGTGTSRYVDASLERVQLKVDGLVEGRHKVLVNGVDLPLRPTGRASEHVAGVRFRAWKPAHCLHPTIDVHHPVRFDLVDTWAQRSLGGFTHHVWHPEGRAYDAPPLTAFEAAARRAQRFTTEGHLPWPVHPRAPVIDPERPFTLDLRRQRG